MGTSSNTSSTGPPRSVDGGNDLPTGVDQTARTLNMNNDPGNNRRSDSASGTEMTFVTNPCDDVTTDHIGTTARHSDVIKTVIPNFPVTGAETRAKKGATDISATIAPTNTVPGLAYANLTPFDISQNSNDEMLNPNPVPDLAYANLTPFDISQNSNDETLAQKGGAHVGKPQPARQNLNVKTLAQKRGANVGKPQIAHQNSNDKTLVQKGGVNVDGPRGAPQSEAQKGGQIERANVSCQFSPTKNPRSLESLKENADVGATHSALQGGLVEYCSTIL